MARNLPVRNPNFTWVPLTIRGGKRWVIAVVCDHIYALECRRSGRQAPRSASHVAQIDKLRSKPLLDMLLAAVRHCEMRLYFPTGFAHVPRSCFPRSSLLL
jgi:hypothetical protein